MTDRTEQDALPCEACGDQRSYFKEHLGRWICLPCELAQLVAGLDQLDKSEKQRQRDAQKPRKKDKSSGATSDA